MSPPRSITVVGGGISGLSAAFHLSRRFPPRSGTRITLLEKSPRLGGWIRSERVRVEDEHGHKANILLESGPRTLRPTSNAILELINILNLSSSVLTVPRTSPAARKRFLHLPNTTGITAIPTSLFSLLRSPLAKVIITAVLKDARISGGAVLNTSSPNDESVDAFLARHFGSEFAQAFGSALVHGIYATDSRLLSVRAAFSTLCDLEERGRGSVIRSAIHAMIFSTRKGADKTIVYDLGGVKQLMMGVSVYSFYDGMQTLTDGMEKRLAQQSNVDIIKGEGLVSLKRNANAFELTTELGRRITSSHLVTAIPLPRLHQMLANSPGSSNTANHTSSLSPTQSRSSLPHLKANSSSSVTVVNLVFPPTRKPIHPPGFGYLIPRPSADYPASSLGMLGTVFDSCALPRQDTLLPLDSPLDSSSNSPRFTKLTVMLGGPYGTPSPPPSSPTFLPTLLATLGTHLGRAKPLPEPCLVRIHQHADCIPMPTVGHEARMAELADAVRALWGANAAVIGAGVGGVSVGDCVESGRRVAYELVV